MQKESFWALLSAYTPFNDVEFQMRADMNAFVQKYENPMDRTATHGHITGSAWVISLERTHVLFTHHKKLNRWLQLGGHAEDEITVLPVAIREAQEESGLKSLKLLSNHLFSIDIHEIPAKGDFPAHLHYDMRFVFEADMREPLMVSSESNLLKWVPLDEVSAHNSDPSILRMLAKTHGL
jgi:8-oxo-dGTP pyrophosphatase MutT (NUDIX family)